MGRHPRRRPGPVHRPHRRDQRPARRRCAANPSSRSCEDADGAMWFGTRLGLTRWKDGQERTYTTRRRPAQRPGATPSTRARSGEVWVGHRAGLARWRDGRIEPPFAAPGAAAVSSLYVDRAGDAVDRHRRRAVPARDDGQRRAGAAARPAFRPAADPRHPGGRPGRAVGDLGRRAGAHRATASWCAGERTPAAPRAARGPGHLPRRRRHAVVRHRRRPGAPARRRACAPFTRRRRAAARLAVPGAARRPRLPVGRHQPHHLARRAGATLDEVDRAAHAGRAGLASTPPTRGARSPPAARARPGAWKARDGRLWFATAAGWSTIDPRRVPRQRRCRPPVLIEQALVDGRAARARTAEPLPARLGQPGVPLRRRHPARAAQGPAPLPAGGLRRRLGRRRHPPGGLLHQHPARALPLPGAGQQRRRRLERGRATPGAARWRRTSTRPRWFYALLRGWRWPGWRFSLYRARLARLRGQYLAAFAERSRVARELHDSLLQGMSAAALELENLRAPAARRRPGAAATPARGDRERADRQPRGDPALRLGPARAAGRRAATWRWRCTRLAGAR